MQKNRRIKDHLKTVVAWTLIFGIFYFFSYENRIYRTWNTENKRLFSTYFEMKKVSIELMPPDEKILIDISEWKNWENPFQNRLLGNTRKAFFFLLSPRLKTDSTKLNLDGSNFQVEMLNKERTFEISKKIPVEEIRILSPKDLKGLKKFMEETDIMYFLVHYKNWWRKTRELKSAGFNLLRSNNNFILCSIEERTEP